MLRGRSEVRPVREDFPRRLDADKPSQSVVASCQRAGEAPMLLS